MDNLARKYSKYVPSPIQRLHQSKAAKADGIAFNMLALAGKSYLKQKRKSSPLWGKGQVATGNNGNGWTHISVGVNGGGGGGGTVGVYTSTSSTTVTSLPLISGTSATNSSTWYGNHPGPGTTGLITQPPIPTVFSRSLRIVNDGMAREILLPDGAILNIKGDGSYTINDTDAKVTYRANRNRDFNSYLNASDKLESFIKFCGENGVKQHEMLDLPIKLFIAWLVVESAKADQEPVPDVPLLPDLRKSIKPTCASCGKFLSDKLRKAKLVVCSSQCFDNQLQQCAA